LSARREWAVGGGEHMRLVPFMTLHSAILYFLRTSVDVRPGGSAAATYAMDFFELQLVSGSVVPRWLNVEHVERVPVSDNQVTLDGTVLRLCGRRIANGQVQNGECHIAPGTLVEVWRDANGLFVCARAEDVDSVLLAQAARDAAVQAALQEQERRLRALAADYNTDPQIPLSWVARRNRGRPRATGWSV